MRKRDNRAKRGRVPIEYPNQYLFSGLITLGSSDPQGIKLLTFAFSED